MDPLSHKGPEGDLKDVLANVRFYDSLYFEFGRSIGRKPIPQSRLMKRPSFALEDRNGSVIG